MAKTSAGILLYQLDPLLKVFLVHPGGPFWKNKDEGAWTIPKGLFEANENPFTAAKREFNEETGTAIEGDFIELEPIRQKGGKIIYCWAVEGDLDISQLKSNMFTIEWPLKSGRKQEFPEVDQGEWFYVPTAKNKMISAQTSLIDQLVKVLDLNDDQITIPSK